MKVKKFKISDIIPADYNPRIDLRDGDFQFEELKKSIDRYGFVKPLIVNERNNVLISGHQRLKVLIEQGVTEVDCVVVNSEDELEKGLNIVMNQVSGDFDYGVINEIINNDNYNVNLLGFTEAEINIELENSEFYEPFFNVVLKYSDEEATYIEFVLNQYGKDELKRYISEFCQEAEREERHGN